MGIIFNHKVAAITGAGSGLGQALAIELSKHGCDLALADIDEQGLSVTKSLLETSEIKITCHTIDVSNEASVFKWADQVYAEHQKVNFVFNNAGVALSGTVAGLSLQDYEWVMKINFWGVVYGTKAFLPYLEKSEYGHIVNLSSISGITAQPLMSGYNASKFAVRGFTEALRQDLMITRSKVTASCVHPGGIKTNIAKTSRMDKSVVEATGNSREKSIEEFEKLFFLTPEKAAQIILKGVTKKKPRILVGTDARFLDRLARLFPSIYQKLLAKLVIWKSNPEKNNEQ